MEIIDHKLSGAGITQVSTPKNQVKFQSGLPNAIIIHYTAGGSASGAANWLAKGDVKASAHLIIGRDGQVYQLVPFDTIAWHAGRSEYAGRQGYNQYSIGIELDNAGFLTKSGNIFRSSFGGTYGAEDVLYARHPNEQVKRYWHTYTEAQLKQCHEICLLLKETYNITEILGHDEIAPGRKQDPGPAFPMSKFRGELLPVESRKEDDVPIINQNGRVVAAKLNIRSSGSVTAPKVAMPLSLGQEVEIIEEQDGWLKVSTTIEGWVSKAYIERR